jgi:carboxyl-terminal processing protease
MKLDRLVQMIRGEKGTLVRLKVIPSDAIDPSTRLIVSLTRDEIKLVDQEAKAKIIKVPQTGGKTLTLGMIDLPSFYSDMKGDSSSKSTTRDIEELLGALKKEGIDGLIMDLRRNGGGSLSEVVSMTGLFIPKGPVVQVKDARGSIRTLKDSDSSLSYSGPMLILTSRASASASEIFAAALQDYGRAAVIGEKSTFGKGTVQSLIDLASYLPGSLSPANPGAVKLTIQKFYRVSGGSTQNRGVIPDIRLPSVDDMADMTESSAPHALPYDEVEPARYERLDTASASSLAALERNSSQRVVASREFQWVNEDISLFKKRKEEKFISLNETVRLAEKKTDEDRNETRKKERAAHPAPDLSPKEITLESIASGKPVVAVSTPAAPAKTADNNASYEHAPPAPDYVLDESVHILADLIGLTSNAEQAASSHHESNIP